eukprot:scaffold37382_cov30-Tisochrysis_lutea.AAC.1
MNNIWIYIYTETNYLGEIAATSTVAHPGKDGTFHPPAKWEEEEGLKGPKHMEFPLAEEYTLGDKRERETWIWIDQVRNRKGG